MWIVSALFVLLLLVLLGVGLPIGWGLHWLIPGIYQGNGTVAGVIAIAAAITTLGV